jgi:hypothetical protein
MQEAAFIQTAPDSNYYEAAAVTHCIAAGKTEAPEDTLQDTLVNMTLLVDEIRSQLGVKPTNETIILLSARI